MARKAILAITVPLAFVAFASTVRADTSARPRRRRSMSRTCARSSRGSGGDRAEAEATRAGPRVARAVHRVRAQRDLPLGLSRRHELARGARWGQDAGVAHVAAALPPARSPRARSSPDDGVPGEDASEGSRLARCRRDSRPRVADAPTRERGAPVTPLGRRARQA